MTDIKVRIARTAILRLVLAMAPVILCTGCPREPCKGSGCAGTSSGSGNATPGSGDPDATTVDDVTGNNAKGKIRCVSDGNIGFFPQGAPGDLEIFFKPEAGSQPVHPSDPLTVYWTICNYNNTVDQPEDPTKKYRLVVTRVTDKTEVFNREYTIPALAHCDCTAPKVVFDGSSVPPQDRFQPDKYTFALSGALETQSACVISAE